VCWVRARVAEETTARVTLTTEITVIFITTVTTDTVIRTESAWVLSDGVAAVAAERVVVCANAYGPLAGGVGNGTSHGQSSSSSSSSQCV